MPGETRVGHRHRDHHAPADDPRDGVETEVGAVVARQPADDRHVARDGSAAGLPLGVGPVRLGGAVSLGVRSTVESRITQPHAARPLPALPLPVARARAGGHRINRRSRPGDAVAAAVTLRLDVHHAARSPAPAATPRRRATRRAHRGRHPRPGGGRPRPGHRRRSAGRPRDLARAWAATQRLTDHAVKQAVAGPVHGRAAMGPHAGARGQRDARPGRPPSTRSCASWPPRAVR